MREAQEWWVDSWTTDVGPRIVKETLIRKVDDPVAEAEYELPSGVKCHVEQRFLDDLSEGDELWIYCSDPWTWEHCCGKAGFAIIRDGEVVEFREAAVN